MHNIYFKSIFDLLHLLATISWFGMLFANVAVIRPSVQKSLPPAAGGPFMQLLMKKTRMVVYISFAVLFITGIPLKIVNENYVSIINFSNNWQIAMFIKHVLVAVLILLAIINFEIVMPRYSKAAQSGPSPDTKKLFKMQAGIGMISVAMALVIITISAIMNFL